jgi:elongation factor P
MKIDGSAIRPRMVLEYNGRLVLVTNIKIGTPGNLRSFNQVEMKDVKTGNKTNYRFGAAGPEELSVPVPGRGHAGVHGQ